ncbi:MAG: hypothetical protein ABI156_01000, partial [Caldimonas sp.]
SQSALLGALLAYRAIYYLLPLAIATVTFFAIDSRGPAKAAGSLTARAMQSADTSKRPRDRRAV